MAQPDETTIPENVIRQISPIIAKYQDRPEMLMRMLLEIQEVSGNSIPQNVAVFISRAIDVPVSKIFDFTQFYSMFSSHERGHYIVRMCDSAPCHVCGSGKVARAFMQTLGLSQVGDTTSDGMFTFEYCQCLGVCDAAPAAIIGDVVHGNLTESSVQDLVADLRNEVEG
ncbi:MAG: NAD(P)H-dependent oxidoreductase subunit E [Propionibacteriaceae bacterium]|nr:NAD(P)H-dependent oxidoreductase subunit E [Propionibacteriaceae bacterium]